MAPGTGADAARPEGPAANCWFCLRRRSCGTGGGRARQPIGSGWAFTLMLICTTRCDGLWLSSVRRGKARLKLAAEGCGRARLKLALCVSVSHPHISQRALRFGEPSRQRRRVAVCQQCRHRRRDLRLRASEAVRAVRAVSGNGHGQALRAPGVRDRERLVAVYCRGARRPAVCEPLLRRPPEGAVLAVLLVCAAAASTAAAAGRRLAGPRLWGRRICGLEREAAEVRRALLRRRLCLPVLRWRLLGERQRQLRGLALSRGGAVSPRVVGRRRRSLLLLSRRGSRPVCNRQRELPERRLPPRLLVLLEPVAAGPAVLIPLPVRLAGVGRLKI